MAAQTAWFVVYPASEHPGNSVPANAKVVSAQVGSPAYNAWTANGSYTISGQSWQVDAGPFSTEAQAESWSPHPLGISDWVAAGVAGVVAGAGNEPSPAASVGLGSAVGNAAGSTLAGLAQIGAFFAALTDRNTWIRVAKVIIGGTLLIISLAHITGADNAVSRAARTVPLPI
jgi:hypothetical protein